MPVLSGRAKSGVRSVLRAAFFSAAAILGLNSCGNDTFTYGTPVITFSATPGPFTAYIAEVDQIYLTRTDNVPVYPLLQPQIIDFVKLADTPEVFGAPAILEGTYTSATITVNYAASTYQLTGALTYMNVNGVSTFVKPVTTADSSGSVATSVTYTVKFDPAHPLVIKHGVSTPIDFHFDMSASTIVNATTSPIQVSARPYMTVSTLPVYKKPMRARGVYVSTDTSAKNNFTINARSFFDTQGSPVGAIEIQTNENTSYNVNGTMYKGVDGLNAISKLQINTIVEAKGTLGDLNNVKPNFVATEVYAGIAVENVLTARITGTVSSRNGNTLHIKGAEIETFNANTPIGEYVSFQDDLTMTIGANTVVNVDGHPELAGATTDYISVGQVVDMEALAVVAADGTTLVKDANGNATWSVASGLVRLSSTTGWATLTSAASGSLTGNLITLGDYPASLLNFTGSNSDPTAYSINTAGLDTSALAAGAMFSFDGLVNPFGMTPPDFVAQSVTPVSTTDQIMTVEWTGSGTTTPFVTKDANGLVVNITGGSLGATPLVQTGPPFQSVPATLLDLSTLPTNPRIVADTTVTSQFALGNPSSIASPATGVSVFNDFTSYLTAVNTALNGTNTVLKLVAVGKYDQPTNTFTAYRINLVQLP